MSDSGGFEALLDEYIAASHRFHGCESAKPVQAARAAVLEAFGIVCIQRDNFRDARDRHARTAAQCARNQCPDPMAHEACS